jgi:adenine-specific DNA-methyltransferase
MEARAYKPEAKEDAFVSRLNDLLRQLRMENPALADDLQREFDALADRRSFGLNFERHVPEAVELPGRRVRKGDKVRMLPARRDVRTADNDRLWRVTGVVTDAGVRRATLVSLDEAEDEALVAVADLVVVAEFRDPTYPGLVSTGTVERGGDKPFHTIINAENFHALQTLLFTHRGKIDCIYIDPPYNAGAKDWKYNNDYVESDDLYRHSKWLAFMERRLGLAKELLNPNDSVLVVTIDEKEYLRLGLLLEQTFPEATIQMISSVINPKGTARTAYFSRTNEYIFFVFLGIADVPNLASGGEAAEVRWRYLRRTDVESRRGTTKGGPAQFYPIYVNTTTHRIERIGDPLAPGDDRQSVAQIEGCVAVFPIREEDGMEMNWGLVGPSLQAALDEGFVRVGIGRSELQRYVFAYLTGPNIKKIAAGELIKDGRRQDGSWIVVFPKGKSSRPTTQWRETSHDAGAYGTSLLRQLLPERKFPFPKSLFAVEDTLRLIMSSRHEAVVLDFFAGSGTTAHAVMRLNKEDGGHRRSIAVTNNEVAAHEQAALREKGLRPGDPDWERWGICEYITKPRVAAAITGKTPDGEPIKGDYKFTNVFPMADGFEENLEFFTLTYEAPLRMASNREFTRIAPLLWLRAGSKGRRIDDISKGWDVADVYGVIADLDQSAAFLKAIAESDDVAMAFVVTDEDRLFESLVAALPDHVDPVRLYEAYLRNFEIEAGRGAR